MFQAIAKLEVIIENKAYHFFCDSNSTIEHVKEALFQIQKIVAGIEDQIRAAQEVAKRAEEEANPSQEAPAIEEPIQQEV